MSSREQLLDEYHDKWEKLIEFASDDGRRSLIRRIEELEYALGIYNPAYSCPCAGCRQEELANAPADKLREIFESAVNLTEDSDD